MALFVPLLAFSYGVLDKYFRGWKKFLLPFVYPVAVIVATPSYVAYICYVAIRRTVDLEYQPDDSFDGGDGPNGQLPGIFKFSEITLESEIQLILGDHNNPVQYKERVLF